MGEVGEDRELVGRVLEGDAPAVQAFRERYHPILAGSLLRRCTDARSRERAEEIAADVFADCFGAHGKKPLLEIWSGRIPLDRWIVAIALNRLKNWWRSGRWRFETPEGYLAANDDGSPPDVIEGAGAALPLAEDFEVVALLSEALLAAFRAAPVRDLVFLRLVHLYGVKRVRLAAAWGIDNATVGRRMDSAAETIRRETLAHLARLDPSLEITWEDCLAICARHPQVLLGDPVDREDDVVEGLSEENSTGAR